MSKLEKGSTFKNRDKTVTVVGRFRDGTPMGRTISDEKLAPLKAAVSRLSGVLGRENALKEGMDRHGSYRGLIQDLVKKEYSNIPDELQDILRAGAFNVENHLDVKNLSGELPPDIFVGTKITTADGISYRVQCPFARISTAWIKLENKVRGVEHT